MKAPVFATVWRPGEGTSCELDLNDDKPDGDMSKVLRALSVHGYVILKRATEVEEFWDGKVQDLSDHELVQKIINANNEDGFLVVHHECTYVGAGKQPVQYSENAARRADPMFLAFHLGGERGITQWVIDCDEGLRGEMTGTCVPVKAEAGDIFLCNCRHARSNPAPCIPEDVAYNFIRTQYRAKTST